jgi:hypothetical protein
MLTDNKCEYWCKNELPEVKFFRFSISRYFEGLFIDNFRGEYGGLMQKRERSRGPLPHSSLSESDLRGVGSNLWGFRGRFMVALKRFMGVSNVCYSLYLWALAVYPCIFLSSY